ncbi:MAG TPA: cytochrome c, partial [Terriglobales bacterium]|nr:cytochrome c [Terriglobales bacterium]
MRKKVIAIAFFGFVSLLLSAQAFAQSDVIEQRQKLMKQQGADAKAIKGGVDTKDYATVEAKAKDLMGTSEKIVSLFPKGSTTGKTKATGAIW